MSNRNLYCSSTNCVHNCNNDCRAGSIHIRGNSATKVSETTCTTHFADSVGFFTNAIEVGGDTTPENIICEAYNCVYCKDLNYTAPNVNINCNFSSCETFKCK